MEKRSLLLIAVLLAALVLAAGCVVSDTASVGESEQLVPTPSWVPSETELNIPSSGWAVLAAAKIAQRDRSLAPSGALDEAAARMRLADEVPAPAASTCPCPRSETRRSSSLSTEGRLITIEQSRQLTLFYIITAHLYARCAPWEKF